MPQAALHVRALMHSEAYAAYCFKCQLLFYFSANILSGQASM